MWNYGKYANMECFDNHICDQICENVHSSHIHFFNFGGSYNFIGMTDEYETCRDCRTTIPVSLLKVSNLNPIPCGSNGSPNVQNWMCELCTFSQIRSHFLNHGKFYFALYWRFWHALLCRALTNQDAYTQYNIWVSSLCYTMAYKECFDTHYQKYIRGIWVFYVLVRHLLTAKHLWYFDTISKLHSNSKSHCLNN